MSALHFNTAETGETYLAKKDGEILKYGNQTQAETKLAKILKELASQNKKGAIVKQGSRFLVLVFEPMRRGPLAWENPGFGDDDQDARDTAAVNRLNELEDMNRGSRPFVVGRDPERLSYPERAIDLVPAGEAHGRMSCREADLDLHADTASRLFDKPADEITEEERRAAKTVNFKDLYGADFGNTPSQDLILMQAGTSPRILCVDEIGAGPLAKAVAERLSPSDRETLRHEVLTLAERKQRLVNELQELKRRNQTPQGPGKIFATVSGPRINPRNRHNLGDGMQIYAPIFNAIKSDAQRLPRPSSASYRNEEQQEIKRRMFLRYKLTGETESKHPRSASRA